jgi:hypothetical protein
VQRDANGKYLIDQRLLPVGRFLAMLKRTNVGVAAAPEHPKHRPARPKHRYRPMAFRESSRDRSLGQALQHLSVSTEIKFRQGAWRPGTASCTRYAAYQHQKSRRREVGSWPPPFFAARPVCLLL